MAVFVLGLVMYGIPDPYDRTSTAPCLYTDGKLWSADPGLPSELTGCHLQPLIQGRPGQNWGADPRHPTGQGAPVSLKLKEDKLGTLATLFQADPGAVTWGIDSQRLTTLTTAVTLVGNPSPSDNTPYFLNRECVTLVATSTPTDTYGTMTATLTRARCGSVAQVHCLRPSDYSEGEDGSQDRIWLKEKPDWDIGFYCGIYLFRLDQYGAIESYILRRGRVAGEPTSLDGKSFVVDVEYLEDVVNSHTVGGTSKEVTLQYNMLVTKLEGTRATHLSFLLSREQAEGFFDEPLARRGSDAIDDDLLESLDDRLKSDSKVKWQVKLKHGDDWVYQINALSPFQWTSDGVQYNAVELACTLVSQGYQEGATVLTEASTAQSAQGYLAALKPWYLNAITDPFGADSFASGSSNDSPPSITLRVKIGRSMVRTFLSLCLSTDGVSNGTYDTLVGGFGAGLPPSYFKIGSAATNPLTISGTTSVLLELDQLIDEKNTYYFDLSQGVSLKDFLTNEFIVSRVFLGSLQSGLLTLKLWDHGVTPTVTLVPKRDGIASVETKRLTPIKRLDLSSGIRVLTLEPTQKRSVRYRQTTNIQPKHIQPLRFWRGVNLKTGVEGRLSTLIESFFRQFGGAPLVYTVSIPIGQWMDEGFEFGDQVNWSDPDILTPSGRGITGIFYVIGLDLNFDRGFCDVLLLQNNSVRAWFLTHTAFVSPVVKVKSVVSVSSLVADVTVGKLDGTSFSPGVDYGGIFSSVLAAGSYLRIDNRDHAPLATTEKVGSIEVFARLTQISVSGGSEIVFRLTVDSSFLRGPYSTAADIFETRTRISLPDRVSAQELSGTLVEPVPEVLVAQFASIQRERPLGGARFSFGS